MWWSRYQVDHSCSGPSTLTSHHLKQRRCEIDQLKPLLQIFLFRDLQFEVCFDLWWTRYQVGRNCCIPNTLTSHHRERRMYDTHMMKCLRRNDRHPRKLIEGCIEMWWTRYQVGHDYYVPSTLTSHHLKQRRCDNNQLKPLLQIFPFRGQRLVDCTCLSWTPRQVGRMGSNPNTSTSHYREQHKCADTQQIC